MEQNTFWFFPIVLFCAFVEAGGNQPEPGPNTPNATTDEGSKSLSQSWFTDRSDGLENRSCRGFGIGSKLQESVRADEVPSDQFIPLSPGIEIRRHYDRRRGDRGSFAEISGELVYANTGGSIIRAIGVSGRRIADDVTTAAVGGCDVSAYEILVGVRDSDGTGDPYTVEYGIWTACPGASPPGQLVPGTEGTMTFDDDGLLHLITVDLEGSEVYMDKDFWVGAKFVGNIYAGWVAGAPAEMGFTQDIYDTQHPALRCKARFAGTNLYAGFYIQIWCNDDPPPPMEFMAYYNPNLDAHVFTPGPSQWVADDITLIVEECELSSLETAVVGASGPFTMNVELWNQWCDPDMVVEGTQRTYEGQGDGYPELAQFEFVDEEGQGVSVNGSLWIAWQFDMDNTGPIKAGEPVLGESEDLFGFLEEDQTCSYWWFGGSPYAAFNATIRCLGCAPWGACCDLGADELCREGPQINCLGPAARWAEGRTCDDPDAFDPPCGTAACCRWDGTCEDLTASDCEALEGEWQPGHFCFNFACPHICDDCVDALPMEDFDECVPEDVLCLEMPNAEATTSDDDPGFCCHPSGAGTQGAGSIWFTFVASETSARFDACTTIEGGGEDSLLEVYAVGDPSTPETACASLTPLACNDDTASCGVSGDNSQFDVFGLSVDTTYYVQLASKTASKRGRYLLKITSPSPAPPPPGNNTCATTATAAEGTTPFDLENATMDCPIELCLPAMQNDVWFEYLATDPGFVVVETCGPDAGSSPNTTLAVYEGAECPVDAGWRIACNDDAGGDCGAGSRVYLTVDGNASYKIRVGGENGGEPSGTLTITRAVDCQPNGIPDSIDIANCPPDDPDCQDCNGNDVPDFCDIRDGIAEDCNENNVPDECDLASGMSEDCNANEVPDECDLAEGTSDDCNANAIPDECDLADGTSEDCNANEVPDECDLAEGTSEDCNSNGIPDECDLVAGTSRDCNVNGIPDECDIAGSTSEDCNGNGVPDECDLAGGASEDCNENGVPDECDIAEGTSKDRDGNGIPDECQEHFIPAVSEWSLVILALFLLTAGKVFFHARRQALQG